jgi:hypothetical protein
VAANSALAQLCDARRAPERALGFCALFIFIVSASPVRESRALDGRSPVTDNIFDTYGIHNDAAVQNCTAPKCVYERTSGEPADPLYPAYWTSHWVMYRVFKQYEKYPPPYDGRPPAPLREGTDYQASWGVSFYDSTWTGSQGKGAMEEHYDSFCIPIFPFANNYSCSFISLGETAFFVTYEDRPSWMPPVCLFSSHNHPPERDFIKHLPYARNDSAQLKGLVNAYSFWIGPDGRPFQTGVTPDQTVLHDILFGYAFYAKPTPERVDRSVSPYPHPQSFYFSGVPYLAEVPLPNAPIVSQNYTDFAMVKPDPRKTWEKVAKIDPTSLPDCHLFNPPSGVHISGKPLGSLKGAIPTWGYLGNVRR